jgi:hypothetical protein
MMEQQELRALAENSGLKPNTFKGLPLASIQVILTAQAQGTVTTIQSDVHDALTKNGWTAQKQGIGWILTRGK